MLQRGSRVETLSNEHFEHVFCPCGLNDLTTSQDDPLCLHPRCSTADRHILTRRHLRGFATVPTVPSREPLSPATRRDLAERAATEC